MSDSNLSEVYFKNNRTIFKISQDPKTTTRWGGCEPFQYNVDSKMIVAFKCWDRDYIYGGLTLVFIYLPSCFTVATILGPYTSGWCSLMWGLGIGIIGFLLSFLHYANNMFEWILGWFFVVIGFATFLLGFVLIPQQWSKKKSTFGASFRKKFLFFPILVSISPLIFLYIKFLKIIKRDSKIIECQRKMASVGEAILEASPQYCLQMYVVLRTLDPTWSQWFSIFTSLFSLNYASIEKYHGPQFSIQKDVFKLQTLVIFLNTCGKILSISVLLVFFQVNTLIIIACYWILLFFILLIFPGCLYGLIEENDWWNQVLDACILGFINQSNMNGSRCAKIVRIIVFYSSLILYLVFMLFICVICNFNLYNIVVGNGIYGDVIWYELAIVQKISILNAVCGLTTGCLISSWLLDILCQFISVNSCVYHAGLSKEAVCSPCSYFRDFAEYDQGTEDCDSGDEVKFTLTILRNISIL